MNNTYVSCHADYIWSLMILSHRFPIAKQIENVGSQSGATSKPVVIADCGQLS